MSWDAEDVALLKKLWAVGQSAAQIVCRSPVGKADVHRKADVRKTPTRDIAQLPRGRAPRKRRAREPTHMRALIGEHKVYASVAESLDEKVERRTHLGHAMPTLRASSSSSAEGALKRARWKMMAL